MTFGSLFAGIGGFDLGLERAGMTCRWQVEVDAYAREILARHWPDVPRWSDIRLLDPAWCEPVDLLCGGFPCQDISSAGKGAGITGRRSGLWREMLRLVRELRPRWVLAENVSALRTRGADTVLGDLEAAGYACWPLVVGAWAVGAPHRRDRVWIVGRRVEDAGHGREPDGPRAARREGGERLAVGGEPGAAGELADAECGALRNEPGRRSGTNGAGATELGADGLADRDGTGRGGERGAARRGELPSGNLPDGRRDRVADPGRLGREGERGHHRASGATRWPGRPGEVQQAWEAARTLEPRLGRAAHGLSRRLALKALGNAVVPQVAEVIGRAILRADA